MKRSEINRALRDMEKMIDRCSFKLPPFCYFTPEEWNEKGHEYDEVRDNMLGWDITDFGMGDFDKVGFSLITLRNGNVSMDKYTKPYAEKLLYMKEGQSAAMHFHWNKMEDIINRGGGNLMIKVYGADENDNLSDEDVEIQVDGRHYTVPAGTVVRLTPGMSMTNTKKLYHSFWGEEGHGKVLVGEVSQCNDDSKDNRFFEPVDTEPYKGAIKDADPPPARFFAKVGRFPEVEEDEAPLYLLGNEYPEAK